MTLEASAVAALKAQIEYLAFTIDQVLAIPTLEDEWPSLVKLQTDNLDVLNGLLLRKGGAP